MESNVIVWDLETTPNLPAAARALGLSERPEDEIREELDEKFPKLPLHKIVCIGALIASRVGEGWQVDALGAPHLGQRTEGDLIRDFVSRIESLRPQLVTFNGSSFDLPVLRYRAMINRIAAPGLSARPYFHRYYDDAIDLCDVLGSFQSQARTKLDELAKVLDLDGKPTGIKGGNVEEMVAAGGIDEVAWYCETDVLNTYLIWLRYQHFRGAIQEEELVWSEKQATDFVASRKSANPYFRVD